MVEHRPGGCHAAVPINSPGSDIRGQGETLEGLELIKCAVELRGLKRVVAGVSVPRIHPLVAERGERTGEDLRGRVGVFSTTHKYIKAIYEKFGVNGRAALMALWLGA